MKSTISLILLFFTSTLFVQAQVLQNAVVEHFTNTRCGICASKNPGLFGNLANNPTVLHIATHPSSPYSSCVLYQHNTTENNARTNFYGILGGTPRIVINGRVMSAGVNFSSTTLFDTFKTKMSPIEIRVEQQKFGTDSIRATITVKAVAAHTFSIADMYVPLVEDSLNYNAPNGEKLHHNVFRKSFSNGYIQLPAMGDSTIFTYTLAGNAAWNFKQLKAMAFIQNSSNKAMIQAAEYSAARTINPTQVIIPKQTDWTVYPNPVLNQIHITSASTGSLKVLDPNGKVIMQNKLDFQATINTENWSKGVYLISLSTNQGTIYKRVIKN